MIYSYDNLEEALNYAAGRVPRALLLQFIRDVEHVITTRDDGSALEKTIYTMVERQGHRRRAGTVRGTFRLERLQDTADTASAH